MNCYNHTDSPAHGICSVCRKALCKSCMAEDMASVCCRGECQTKAKNVEEIIRRALI